MDDPLLRKPPPHLEGTLLLQDSKKFGKKTWIQRHIVVVRDTLFIHRVHGKGKKDKELEFETFSLKKDHKEIKSIPLQQVEISETITTHVPEGHSVNWAFRIEFAGETTIFLASSFEDQKRWVEGLQYVKKFWRLKLEAEMLEEKAKKQRFMESKNEKSAASSDTFRISVTGFNGKIHALELPRDAKFKELYRGINGNGPCADRAMCLIKEKAAQLWAMDKQGNDSMVRKLEKIHLRFEQGCEFFLLEHGNKLMVVQFPDGKFMAMPVDAKITAKEVTKIDKFASKLMRIGCTNVGLFLKKPNGQELQFTEEERPLEMFYINQDGIWKRNPNAEGYLILRNKTLKQRSDSTEFDDSAVQSGQFRAKKIVTDDAQKQVKQELNKLRKRQANRPENQMQFSDEHFSDSIDLDRSRSQSNSTDTNPFIIGDPNGESTTKKSVPGQSEPEDLNPVYLSSSLTDRYTRFKSYKVPDSDKSDQKDSNVASNANPKPVQTGYSIKRENSQIRSLFAGLGLKTEGTESSQKASNSMRIKTEGAVSTNKGAFSADVTGSVGSPVVACSSDTASPDQMTGTSESQKQLEVPRTNGLSTEDLSDNKSIPSAFIIEPEPEDLTSFPPEVILVSGDQRVSNQNSQDIEEAGKSEEGNDEVLDYRARRFNKVRSNNVDVRPGKDGKRKIVQDRNAGKGDDENSRGEAVKGANVKEMIVDSVTDRELKIGLDKDSFDPEVLEGANVQNEACKQENAGDIEGLERANEITKPVTTEQLLETKDESKINKPGSSDAINRLEVADENVKRDGRVQVVVTTEIVDEELGSSYGKKEFKGENGYNERDDADDIIVPVVKIGVLENGNRVNVLQSTNEVNKRRGADENNVRNRPEIRQDDTSMHKAANDVNEPQDSSRGIVAPGNEDAKINIGDAEEYDYVSKKNTETEMNPRDEVGLETEMNLKQEVDTKAEVNLKVKFHMETEIDLKREVKDFGLKYDFQEQETTDDNGSCDSFERGLSRNTDKSCDERKFDANKKSDLLENNNIHTDDIDNNDDIDISSTMITEQLDEYFDDNIGKTSENIEQGDIQDKQRIQNNNGVMNIVLAKGDIQNMQGIRDDIGFKNENIEIRDTQQNQEHIGAIADSIGHEKSDIQTKQNNSMDYDEELLKYFDDNIRSEDTKDDIKVNIELYEPDRVSKSKDNIGVILPRDEHAIPKMTTLHVQNIDELSDSDSDASSIESYMESHYGIQKEAKEKAKGDSSESEDSSCMDYNGDSRDKSSPGDSAGSFESETGGTVIKITAKMPGLEAREFEGRQMRSSPVGSMSKKNESEVVKRGLPESDLYPTTSRHRRRNAFREGSIYKEFKQETLKNKIQEKKRIEEETKIKQVEDVAAKPEKQEKPVEQEKPDAQTGIQERNQISADDVSKTNGTSLPRNTQLEEATIKRRASSPLNPEDEIKAASLPSRGSFKCLACNECDGRPFQVNTFKLIELVLKQCSKQSVVNSIPNQYDYICLSGVHLRNTAGIWELADNTSFHSESELTDSLEMSSSQKESGPMDVIASKVAKEKQVMMGNGICCHWLPKKSGLRGKWRVLKSEKKSFRGRENDELEQELAQRPTSSPPFSQVDNGEDKERMRSLSPAFMTTARKKAPSKFQEVLKNLTSAASPRSSSRASTRPPSPEPINVYMSLELISIREQLLVPLNRAVNQIRKHFNAASHEPAAKQHENAAVWQHVSTATQQHQLGDDTVTPNIGWLVRRDFCSALAGLLLLRMKNDTIMPQFMFFGRPTKYNLWSLMKEVARACVDEPVIVQMVNIIEESPFLFDDDLRFRCFVCETLNCPNEAGREKLFMTWYKRFLISKPVIEKFYKPDCIWRHQNQLETGLFVEETCLILSHLNEYTFNLSADFEYKELRRHHVEQNGGLDFTLQREQREVDMGVFTFE